jgi:type 1 glutamine amidotransferase
MMKKYLLIALFVLTGTLNVYPQPGNEPLKLLVFSKTAGYRHSSIPAGLSALKEMTAENNWHIIATEDSTMFNTATLDSFDVVIFLCTSGNILNEDQERALQLFVESGKGLVTIHSGTDTEYDWEWYKQAIGAYFLGHPPVQKATVRIEDRNHPSTSMFPDSVWITEDEWYSFRSNPRDHVHVLISIDESTYDVDDNRWFRGAKQRMGDHPLVWYKMMGKGIVFQSAFGHTDAMFADPLYRKHLEGAILFTKGK